MQRIDGRFVYSASDLNGFLECAALTRLDREAADNLRTRPNADDATALIARKGEEHEQRYLATLRASGLRVSEIERPEAAGAGRLEQAEKATLAAMESGADIVYQATFFDGTFVGHADFLRRVERPCERWAWSYEVLDTKLALRTKTYFLVQLCNYSEHVARLQGTMPARMIVVPGSNVETPYDVSDYLAYYRHLKSAFLEAVESERADPYPHEVSHCKVCNWSPVCEERREADDYLGLVASMRTDAIRRLTDSGIGTIAELAAAPAERRPQGMTPETFERLHSQAALQHAQRTTGLLSYELLPFQENRGFALLPQPDAGDLFFDMEGDPLYTPQRGLEYLFGIYLARENRYVAYWARSAGEERAAFEALVDFLAARRREHPDMHVYHYAPYETTALKRLSGYYATREDDVDALLRAQTFVDLYAVVRQGLRISQPSYSIKKLEPFYSFTRETRTQRGDDSILMFESWLVDGDENLLVDIENYNRDDCISTHRLREWLLERRTELAGHRGEFAWRAAPQPKPEAEAPESEERDIVRSRLLDGLETPSSLAQLRDSDEAYRARWLLGHLLDYHRREDKPAWWAYFYRCENQDELVEFDREAMGGLVHRSDVAPYKVKPRDHNLVHVYRFPEQLHALGIGDNPYALDAARPREAGAVVSIDEDALEIRLKVSKNVDATTLDALAPLPSINSKPLRASLLRTARAYLDGRLESCGALTALLLRRIPRVLQPGSTLQPETPTAAAVSDLAARLDSSYLFVQGPPGSGKSTAGAVVVLDLLRSGKRVAILANAHKAVHNLLHKIEDVATARGQRFRGIQRFSASNAGSRYESALGEGSFIEPSDASEALAQPHDLAAGTAWTFAREELASTYDYLVVDEAGQVSLANALASAPCARNIVLFGDPLQLAQVSQGAHPPGVELSVLEHLLGDDATVLPDRGVFLDRSFRMHPEICSFISESVYCGRLRAADETQANRIASPGLSGSGLRYLPVLHEGNQRESVEEADAIAQAAMRLCDGTYTVATGAEVVTKPLAPQRILVVTPYNAQRRLIAERLREHGLDGVRVGTVDKFQGQEAPVVFYSMATSSGEDAPRDIAFLFEKNRLNVAISRAQCLSVLVCSPRLLDTRCSTPEQMSLVNLLCRYAETATQ